MAQGFDDPRAFWNSRFDSEEYVFGTAPNAFLAAHAHLCTPGQRALCVADGEGRNSVWLAELGLDVVGFDIAPKAVEKAAALARARGVNVAHHCTGVAEWDWMPAAFDLVAAIFVQFAPPAVRTRLFDDMLATLRPGGLLLLEGYTPRQIAYGTGGPGKAEHLYTEGLLREAFGTHEIVELCEYDAEIAEGSAHKGLSALIDCVVRKRV